MGGRQFFNALAALGVSHFKTLFKALLEDTIAKLIRVARIFPSFVEEEDNDNLLAPVTKGEVEGVLKSMQKE